MKKLPVLLISMAMVVVAQNLQAQTKPATRKPVTQVSQSTSAQPNATRTAATPNKKVALGGSYTRSQTAPETLVKPITQPVSAGPVRVTNTQQTTLRSLAAPANTKASHVQIGLRLGGNSSTIGGVDISAVGTGGQFARVTGFHAGIMANIGGPAFSVQPEILFSQYGVRMKFGADYVQLKYSLVEVPVLLKATFGQPNLRFFINAGPVATYTMNGTVSFQDSGQSGSQKIDLTGTGRLSFGASGGSGVALKMGPGALQLEARYTYLFSSNENGAKLNPQNLMVSAGYLIPLRGR